MTPDPTPTSRDGVIGLPIDGSCWVEMDQGGGGASRVVIDRLRLLLESGLRGDRILVLLPQRDRRELYESPHERPRPGARAQVETFYSLSSRLVRLFWPLVSHEAGFGQPLKAPVQLTYETAQFVMGQVCEPFLRQGYFEGLPLRPQRILSQLLDNLNKAAVNGYDLDEVSARLRPAWTGDREHLVYFEQAQTCIEAYRAHCLERNLLDVSLTLDVFCRHLEGRDELQAYLGEHADHLVVEGVEETVPVAQDFLRRRLAAATSSFLVYRRDGGFRVFLGVDPVGAQALRGECDRAYTIVEPVATALQQAGQALGSRIESGATRVDADPAPVDRICAPHRAGMVDAVAAEVVRLVESGTAHPGDIAIIAPHADGVLRFLLEEALRAASIPCAIVRRFESLRDEPEVRVCLALAALAHEGWQRRPHLSDVSEALESALGIDAIRARLLARAGYDEAACRLRPLQDERLAERVTASAMTGYETLRHWLDARREGEIMPLDLFFRRLFGEVLSRPDLPVDGGAPFARLIASAAWFRRSVPAMSDTTGSPTAAAEGYADMVEEGVVSASHTMSLAAADPTSVLVVAPVYTYLLEERTARFQFWLDVGSISWWEPPHQPLTNPHVLARRWKAGDPWTDAVDFDVRNHVLARLVRGLCSRAHEHVTLCWSEADGGGVAPTDTPLLRAATELLGPMPVVEAP